MKSETQTSTPNYRLTARGESVKKAARNTLALGLAASVSVFGAEKLDTYFNPDMQPAGPLVEKMVSPGDTLWDITKDIEGSENYRPETIELIEDLNPSLSQPLQQGETYIVPTQVEKK